MAKTIKFNTGRQYTAQGQIIIATLHDDGVVTFNDLSRMVTGEFAMGAAYLDHFDARELQAETMHHYDASTAPQTSRSWADGMQQGGCNTESGFEAYREAQTQARGPLMATPAQDSEWSGSPCPLDPDNFWIDDATGERVNATTGERTPALMSQPVQQQQAKAPGAAPKPFRGTIAIDANWQGNPSRTPNQTGQGEHDFTAHATAYDHGNGRSYRVAFYQIGQGTGATVELALYLDGRMLPENQRKDMREAAQAAYRAAFLGLTDELKADYKAARAAQAARLQRGPRQILFSDKPSTGMAGLALGRVYIAHRKGERIAAPKVSTWGPWLSDEQGRPLGERFLEFSTSSQAIRFVGYADEIAGRGIDHKGWYLSDEGDSGEVYRGAVWQLPSRNGRPVFVPGYVETVSGQEGGRLDLGNLQMGEPGGDGDSAKRDAARAGDDLANRDAERERDYQRAWFAGRLYREALEEAQAAKVELRALLAERRAMRAQGLANAAQAICRVITVKARELAFDRAALLAKAEKLIRGDYAERHLFAYWASNDAAQLDAFLDASGLTPDEYQERA